MTSPKESSSNSFKKWLDLLQQESWQLELIISGFSIFGLFQLIDPVLEKVALAQSEDKIFLSVLLGGVLLSVFLCIINLCIHVILRGLWVGALGLRYVSGEIDFEELRYHRWFDNFLRKRIKSFDHFIGRLENYCSIMFAVAFLSIFFILSLFFVMGLMALVVTSINSNDLPSWAENLGGVIVLIIGFSMLFTFLDFLTLGFFKRKKWIAVWYYPIYRFYSVISFSFLYRPLVYNFLDSKFSRRIFVLLFPIYVLLMFVTSIDYQGSSYFSTVSDAINRSYRSEYFASNSNYDDQLTEDSQLVLNVSIPSKKIDENAMPLFLLFKEAVEEDLIKVNPELKVKNDIRGIAVQGMISFGQTIDSTARAKIPLYLNKLSEFYQVQIDTINHSPEFIIAKNKKGQLGFETVLDLQNLSRGKHVVHISRKSVQVIPIPKSQRKDPDIKSRDSIVDKKIVSIPFWYYPN